MPFDIALLAELQEKIDAVQKETKDMKVKLQLMSGAKVKNLQHRHLYQPPASCGCAGPNGLC